jgi:transposase, IS30 family
VVSRDVARHGGRAQYRAVSASEAAAAGRQRPKLYAVERSARLKTVVTELLRGGWSPASIAGRLPYDYRDDQAVRVSHEAIYQWMYAQPVSTLARELLQLRTGHTARRSGPRPAPAPRIKEPRYLDERPAEVEGRQVPGHWEGDLVIGKGGKSAVATLVERTSRFVVLVPLSGRDALTVGDSVIAGAGTPAAADHPLADLGLRLGDGPARADHRSRVAGVLRPPALAVAARQQRESEPYPARILPERRSHHRRPEVHGDGGFRNQRPTP